MSDLFDERHIRVIEHDMEVLYSVHGLERSPILEPNDL